jgi:hypothetical protein
MLKGLDNLFGCLRIYRRLSRGTWTKYRYDLPDYFPDYFLRGDYWSHAAPMATIPDYLTVLNVERWDG